jgi:cytosine/adenosine deaminase-related metal-dependent hydrolase
MLLRARIVMPVTRAPVNDGAVLVSGNRIQAAGSWNDLRSGAGEKVVDLGDSILLPGLVNAHCHLDYTDLAGEIAPTKSFTDWIKVITTAKSGKIYADFAQSWVRGAQMLLRKCVPDAAPHCLLVLHKGVESVVRRLFLHQPVHGSAL